MKVSAAETLETELVDIEVFERAAAIERWREVFERPPPKHLSPRFMTRVLIWEAPTNNSKAWVASGARMEWAHLPS